MPESKKIQYPKLATLMECRETSVLLIPSSYLLLDCVYLLLISFDKLSCFKIFNNILWSLQTSVSVMPSHQVLVPGACWRSKDTDYEEYNTGLNTVGWIGDAPGGGSVTTGRGPSAPSRCTGTAGSGTSASGPSSIERVHDTSGRGVRTNLQPLLPRIINCFF